MSERCHSGFDGCARLIARDFSRIDALTITSMLPGDASDHRMNGRAWRRRDALFK
jgi:hypothetical protein